LGLHQAPKTLPEAAEWYAWEHGLSVLPINPRSKTPAVTFKGRHLSTREVVRHWQQFPDHNLALRCTSFFVVDIDIKDGKNGLESLKPCLHLFPATLKATTPSGGIHLYYGKKPHSGGVYGCYEDLFPDADRPFSQKIGLLDGVDLKWGANTYVLASPSATPKGRYQCANNLPIAVATDELLEFLRGKCKETPKGLPPPSSKAAGGKPLTLPDSLRTFAIPTSWHDSMATARNDTLYKFVAWYLDPYQKHGGYDVEIVYQKAHELNTSASDPLPDWEFEKAFDSAWGAHKERMEAKANDKHRIHSR